MSSLADLLGDLHEESLDLERLVADLDDAGWQRDTPAAGWTVAHQIAHLHWTDQAATLSVTNPAKLGTVAAAAMADPHGFVDRGARDCLA
ncbi:MAG TPA: maleylpyruvate isomerase N-terminal domain-containing protein, partial [Rugosimonospora sp.]|nr:maleylpyruvate isomerase N-terminal domain-containing protein [Rugosimonospora sp.]